MNHIFTQIELENSSNQRKISAEIVEVFIHGHSLYDEAAFYELYMNGVIDSTKLGQFRKKYESYCMIPGFKGLIEKEFDIVMEKWLFILPEQF